MYSHSAHDRLIGPVGTGVEFSTQRCGHATPSAGACPQAVTHSLKKITASILHPLPHSGIQEQANILRY